MNRQLRRGHRWLTAGLAGVTAVVLATAFLARRQVPPTVIPAGLRRGAAPGVARAVAQRPMPGEARIDVRVLADSNGVVQLIEIEPLRRPEAADLLLYYAPGSPADAAGRIPADAVLLGAVTGTRAIRWPLPPGMPPAGALLLYSTATGATIAATSLPQATSEVLQ